MAPPRRTFWALAGTAGVVLGTWRHTTAGSLPWVVCAGLAVTLAVASGRAPTGRLTWALLGLGAAVASWPAEGSFHVVGAFGALAAAVGGAVGLTRIASLGGLLRDQTHPTRVRVAVGLVTASWVPGALLFFGRSDGRLLWTFANAAVLSAAVVLGLGVAARLERHLELGVVERLDAGLLAGALVVVSTAGVAVVSGEVASSLLVGCAAVGVVAAACADLRDPVALVRGVRRAATVGALGLVLAACADVALRVWTSPAVLVALSLAAMTLGAELPRVVRWLRPANDGGAHRLRVTAAARASLEGRDVDAALSAMLGALGTPPPAPSPSLWLRDPAKVLRVDAAGYVHEAVAEVPPELVVVACSEPEVTLRAAALAAVEVRRPDLRGLSRWLRDTRMGVATLVSRGGDVEAVLMLPWADVTLEEARALRELADALAPLCHAQARHARSLTREREAREQADDAVTKRERLEHTLARAAARHELAAARLARPAAVGLYAPASRGAYEALGRLTRAHAPIVMVAPSGVDPVPLLARAHLAGARRQAPLVLVDCTTTREHDLARWCDPVASPLALADGGMLTLLDAAALPADVQRLVGGCLAERRAPWERADALDIVLALTTAEAPRDLVDAGRLDPLLVSRVGAAVDDPIHMPGLGDRAEDLRALVTDRLAREGLRMRGAAVGIDAAAFALLVDHPFEGEEAELASLVQRLVARLPRSRQVLHEADIRALVPTVSSDALFAPKGFPKRFGA